MTMFRKATLAEIRTMLDWAAAEGWNPGLEDAACFQAADPAGFFVAVESGQMVGAISVVNHTPDFAFLGLYLVAPEWRGRGIGYGLWQHALQHAGGRVVGLDGVEAQQANYTRSGFARAGSTTRYSGALQGRVSPEVRRASTDDIAHLIAGEAAASGVEKQGYLQAWFTPTPTRETFVCAGGFCTIRQCREGAKIGPLLAQDAPTAERLLQHAAARFDGGVMIDVPETASALADMCATAGLQPGFRTARMYLGDLTPPSQPFYAVTSLELG